MTTLEAIERFTLMRDQLRSRGENFPAAECSATCNGQSADAWPEAMTAAARLSGALDDAETDLDLVEAIEHFQTLWSIGVSSEDEWNQETTAVIEELLAAGMAEEAGAV